MSAFPPSISFNETLICLTLAYEIGKGCLYTVKVDIAKYALIKVVFDDTREDPRLAHHLDAL